jgi:transposase-like protein
MDCPACGASSSYLELVRTSTDGQQVYFCAACASQILVSGQAVRVVRAK